MDASSWGELWSRYRDELSSDPMLVLALSAALVAFATTPIAFAVLGRMDWFKAGAGGSCNARSSRRSWPVCCW